MLSFTCAYLKANYAAEFLASVISNQGGFYSAFAYLSEARRFGIRILHPDINLSERWYKGAKDRIRMGFMAINRLKARTVENILEERKAGPFRSLDDFIFRMDLDINDAMALTKAGCFTNLAPSLSYREIAMRIACAFSAEKTKLASQPPIPMEPISTEDQIQLEIESFGFPVSQHPLDPYQSFLHGKVIQAKDIPKYEGKSVNIAGVLITRKVVATRQKEPMEFVTFEDKTDIYECVMFPNTYNEFGDLLNWERLFVLRGKVECAFGACTITIERIMSLTKIVEKMTAATDHKKSTEPQTKVA